MLYLLDKPLAEVGLRTVAEDPDAHVVLIQDGVYLSPDVDAELYAVGKDVDVRGVDLPPAVERVPYDAVVELMEEHEVRSFV
ncbi:DsrH/TusB family sulfur metabolism protein [Halostella litorea]|uniref:DsrH/TusB family sulfur metabolism protein n=1 Tax=Halostella litorea TaxID=2528831 RepID=UPI001091AB84|nr:DsrH/TusB family sulfur metabolism protein [Halostella litorea]